MVRTQTADRNNLSGLEQENFLPVQREIYLPRAVASAMIVKLTRNTSLCLIFPFLPDASTLMTV